MHSMRLHWLLTSLALALPAAAQDEVPSDEATPPAPKAVAPAPVRAPEPPATEAPTAASPKPSSAPAQPPAPEAAPAAPSTPGAGKPKPELESPPAPTASPSGEAGPEVPRTAPVAAPATPAPKPIRRSTRADPATASPAELPPPAAPPAPSRAAAPAPAPAPQPAAAPQSAKPPPAASAGAPIVPDSVESSATPPRPAGPETDEEAALRIAQVIFRQLLGGDARALTGGCALPFHLEGKRFEEHEPLFREWLRQLRARRLDTLTLDGLEVLTPQQMEQKHGPPPARLAHLPWKGPRTWIAVASLSGHPAVAVLQRQPNGWRLVAYTD